MSSGVVAMAAETPVRGGDAAERGDSASSLAGQIRPTKRLSPSRLLRLTKLHSNLQQGFSGFLQGHGLSGSASVQQQHQQKVHTLFSPLQKASEFSCF
jgi:hypothetical protein